MNKDKQIEEMLKCVCQNCRYFMRCNDDTMCDGETLSEVLKSQCSIWRIGEAIYNAGYRKQSNGEWVPSDVLRGEDEEWRLYACSVCQHQTESYYRDVRDLSRFCPNCGTKLKGN